jgi:hypothetical protein
MALMAIRGGLRSSGGGASAIIEILRSLSTANSPVPIGLVADYAGRPEGEVREALRKLSDMNAVSLDEPGGTVKLVD